MTTMNNEDPAEVSVHEQRELPEPAAWRVYFPDEQREEFASSLDDLLDDLTNCAHDDPEPLYTADQMREAIAAERALLLTDIAALREALDEAATDCELHPLYLGDSATLDDIIRTGGDAAFVTGLARGLREACGSAAAAPPNPDGAE